MGGWYRKETIGVFPQGLEELYNPSDAYVDIVFVHGLTGDRLRTWTHQDSSKPWPQDILSKFTPKARILTYGYDAYVLGRRGPATKNCLDDHSRDFLNELVNYRGQTSSLSRPLIFVAHSLGGILCKDTMLRSRNPSSERLNDVYTSTIGVAFMGTPHTGSFWAGWGKIPIKCLGVFKSSNKNLLDVLRIESEVLRRIASDFAIMLQNRANAKKAIKIVSFYESLPMYLKQTIVSRDSATLAGYNAISIHANHRDMVKFKHPDDHGLRSLVGELSQWIGALKDDMSSSNAEPHCAKEPDGDSSQMPVSRGHTDVPTSLQEMMSFIMRSNELEIRGVRDPMELRLCIPILPRIIKFSMDDPALFESVIISNKNMHDETVSLDTPSGSRDRTQMRIGTGENPKICQPNGNSQGPLGLSLLYEPDNVDVELIFVHGLGGGSCKTWTYSDPTIDFWPQTFLPHEKGFERCRIHSFGYDFPSGTDRTYYEAGIADFASSLLHSLTCSSELRENPKLPITFVCHSIGGLVVKKAITQAMNNLSDFTIASRFKAVIFFGTPHRGTDVATLVSRLLLNSDRCPIQCIEEVERNSESLFAINDEFRHSAGRLQLCSFYETRMADLPGRLNRLIVEKDSAVLGYPNEFSMPLDASHHHMCKYKNRTDSNYVSVRTTLADIISNLSPATSDANALTDDDSSDSQDENFSAYLDEMDKLSTSSTKRRKTATCHRIESQLSIQQWYEGKRSKKSNLAVIYGPPGIGKSFTARQIFLNLPPRPFIYYYSFEKPGNSKSSGIACLMSFASQLMEATRRSQQKHGHSMGSDPSANWTIENSWEAFSKATFDYAHKDTHHYLVIDAIDQCDQATELLKSLIPPRINGKSRVLMTSRSPMSLNCKIELATAGASLTSLKISPESTTSDMAAFVYENSAKLARAGGYLPNELASEILEKASGCFQWVNLTIKRLQHVHTASRIREVLDSVPPEMMESYSKALQDASSRCGEKRLLKSTLTRAMCHDGSLTVTGLQELVEIDINDRVFDFKRFIEQNCSSFLYLDPEDRVRVAQDTARKFLVGSDALKVLDL